VRRTLDVTIEADNRDKGKVYHLEEMDAWSALLWAKHAVSAAARNGTDLGALDIADMSSMESLLRLGLTRIMSAPDRETDDLVREAIFKCVKFKPGPNALRGLMDGDIEEIATYLKLSMELASLHVGFSIGGAQSKDSTSTSPPPPPPRSHTPTSTKSSETSLPAGRRR
jgi:hypothetical protein